MPSESSLSHRPGSPFNVNVEENVGKRDKHFRRYASAVERALSLFDTALQEWADYISFLSRLVKALQTKPSDTHEIPYSRLVAKRLAQCLSPSLPSGVHQKALEAYAVCFSTLGKDGLAAELFLYLPGLSPLLSFASSSNRPLLLNLFESFVVVLELEVLKPALKAIILSLLPGMEDPSSEEFSRTQDLLNQFRRACSNKSETGESDRQTQDDRFFWQSLFIASISNTSRRPGALAYLERHLPRLTSSHTSSNSSDGRSQMSTTGPPEFRSFDESVVSPEPGLLVRVFAAGFQDDQLLIQRGFLELLVTHLPLNSPVLQQRVSTGDRELLIMAATSVVLRREMNLNRRLWLWLLGQGNSSDQDHSEPNSPQLDGQSTVDETGRTSALEYFESFGLSPLVQGLLKAFNSMSTTPSLVARPFRICLSLMDRWEIGGLVLPEIFKPAMKSVCEYKKTAPSDSAFQEVLRSANVFFDAIQSDLIWKEIIRMLLDALDNPETWDDAESESRASPSLELVSFIIHNFNIHEEEMLMIHIPNTILLLLHYAAAIARGVTIDKKVDEMISNIGSILEMSSFLISKLPKQSTEKRLPTHESEVLPKARYDSPNDESVQRRIRQVYTTSKDVQHRVKDLWPAHVFNHMLFLKSLDVSVACTSKMQLIRSQLGRALDILASVIRLYPDASGHELVTLLSSIETFLAEPEYASPDDLPDIGRLISGLEIIQAVTEDSEWHLSAQVRSVTAKLVQKTWKHISPNDPRYNVDAVQFMWRLHRMRPDDYIVEAAVSNLLYEDMDGKVHDELTAEGIRHFTILWTHSISLSRSTSFRSPSTMTSHSSGPSKSGDLKVDSASMARPLMLILDILRESSSENQAIVHAWLRSLTSLDKIFQLLLISLHESLTPMLQTTDSGKPEDQSAPQDPDLPKGATGPVYWLETLTNILAIEVAHIVPALRSRSRQLELQQSNTILTKPSEEHGATNNSGQDWTVQLHLLSLSTSVLQRALLPQYRKPQALVEACLDLLQQLILVADVESIDFTHVEDILLNLLTLAVELANTHLQVKLMTTIKGLLKRRSLSPETSKQESLGTTSKEYQSTTVPNETIDSTKMETSESWSSRSLDCLMLGLRSKESYSALEDWVDFLEFVLPHYSMDLFKFLIPFVDCICRSIRSLFDDLQSSFVQSSIKAAVSSEPIHSLSLLFNVLEFVLSRAHEQIRLAEAKKTRTPEPSQGYLGTMVTGLFAGEAQAHRPVTANDRLSVLLSFRDAVKVAYELWAWGAPNDNSSAINESTWASFQYTSVRLRNRTRRVLENLLSVEPLECLEVLIEYWKTNAAKSESVLHLLHALEATRPKNTMPTCFNALYSRTNMTVLEPQRQSTLTSDLSEIELAAFLVSYTRSVDDDALDEIWIDCMTFAKDVLANPLPQRQILPLLLEFIAVLGEKIDNTNFGELRRMRREIADLFARLLAAMFTIKPLSFANEVTTASKEATLGQQRASVPSEQDGAAMDTDIITILSRILPNMVKVLIDTDRLTSAASTISQQILMPSFHWKHFPHNVSSGTVEILQTLARVKEISKIWKKDVAEAFTDPRFFTCRSRDMVERGWMPLLRQWSLSDGERMPEILARLSAPTTAGIMFGVGASSARREADRKSQLNLRRVGLLLLSADTDYFVPSVKLLQEKLTELLNATPSSSPSSATRAEIYMVLRALVLKTSPVHLTSMWPTMNAELHDALASMSRIASRETYSITSILQAAKLLDTLLLLAPDEFQLRQWLFVTDTVDAVYRPANWRPVALVDELVEVLDHDASATHSGAPYVAKTTAMSIGGRKPLLQWDEIHTVPRENILEQVLKPFLRHLSINAFEAMYEMEAVDNKACVQELLEDLFDDDTLD